MTIANAEGLVILAYPPGLTTPKVETSETLTGARQELTAPVSNLADQDLVPVVTDRPTRFFRLRMN